ncbi:hypothetical protein RFM41_33330 [Mesorhizobium sp. VK25A]|uniref:Uncharacterized protein n=1 Tax=Mesorhizobium vachelliae TaxID=3072309 RepID=A0ABU5AF00_9HYPH|nr:MULTISPECIES: hypothetical protein [unclassified Mesorhizobium]MDX8535871.1 hypothetical protein [Mesorhizobium sp. VK25D]MDX8548625.1 hypothetical protein [Mesorhizobium sp. VK25A]
MRETSPRASVCQSVGGDGAAFLADFEIGPCSDRRNIAIHFMSHGAEAFLDFAMTSVRPQARHKIADKDIRAPRTCFPAIRAVPCLK